MTDIHLHLLYGIDDGTSSIEESVEIIKRMASIGYKSLIITPHYINDSMYSSSKEENIKILHSLQEELNRLNINVNLYLGNEVFISSTLVEDINSNRVSTLNNTKYILLELPLSDQIINLDDILYNIKQSGYIPIIAHPERYKYFKKNYKLVKALKEDGIFFQCNYASIGGHYGKRARKLFIKLLKDKYVNFLSTDIHKITNTYVLDNFDKLEAKIIKIIGKKQYQMILDNSNSLVK